MTIALKKINNSSYEIDGFRIYSWDENWSHAEKRISEALAKSKGDHEKFKQLMVTRLKKMTKKEKVYYALAVLQVKGFEDVADIYDGKLIMDKLTDGWD